MCYARLEKFKDWCFNFTPDECTTSRVLSFSTAYPVRKIMKKTFKVSVEGNIGCGKSTFLKYFQSFPNVQAYLEPLNEWRNVQGHNLLELLYTDLERWNFTFQHMVQLSRLNIQTHDSPKDIHIFERSVQNNRYCFGQMAYESSLLSDVEFFVFDQWFQWINNNTDISLDLIVYLRCSPEVVYERLQKRSRKEETSIPLDYLRQVHEAHENWLLRHIPEAPPAPVLVINADLDLDSVYLQYKQNQEIILGTLKQQVTC